MLCPFDASTEISHVHPLHDSAALQTHELGIWVDSGEAYETTLFGTAQQMQVGTPPYMTGPAEVGVARGMEKALEDFLAGYAEKRKKALAEAMARIVAATPRNRGPRGEGLSATGFWGAIEW